MKFIMSVDESDLLKILDVLEVNEEFHKNRDLMNSSIHLSKKVRLSPITSETISAKERLKIILEEGKGKLRS